MDAGDNSQKTNTLAGFPLSRCSMKGEVDAEKIVVKTLWATTLDTEDYQVQEIQLFISPTSESTPVDLIFSTSTHKRGDSKTMVNMKQFQSKPPANTLPSRKLELVPEHLQYIF